VALDRGAEAGPLGVGLSRADADVSGSGMETHLKRLIEPVAFYSGLAALVGLSAVIALYLAHWFF